MAPDKATCFRQYPFRPGQKTRIEDGLRSGDWEVPALDHETMTLRCPVSGRQVASRRFCYLVGERTTDWPRED